MIASSSDWTGSPQLAGSCRLSSCVLFSTHHSASLLTVVSMYFYHLCNLFFVLFVVFCCFFNSWGPVSPASFSWSPRACFPSVPWLFSRVPPLAGIHAWAHREEQERTNKQRHKQRQENRCQTARRWRERERERSDAASSWNVHSKNQHTNTACRQIEALELYSWTM